MPTEQSWPSSGNPSSMFPSQFSSCPVPQSSGPGWLGTALQTRPSRASLQTQTPGCLQSPTPLKQIGSQSGKPLSATPSQSSSMPLPQMSNGAGSTPTALQIVPLPSVLQTFTPVAKQGPFLPLSQAAPRSKPSSMTPSQVSSTPLQSSPCGLGTQASGAGRASGGGSGASG